MILALLLAAAEPMTAIDAERAFIADAQKLGQWTAFRKYAADDAIMFLPQADSAQKFLKDRKDPPVSVFWWPGQSYVSCDGKTAVNTGPWVRQEGKSVGYFTTIWQRQQDGSWKWILDHGDELTLPRAEGGDIRPLIASCGTKPTKTQYSWAAVPSPKASEGRSQDGTLYWSWMVDRSGARQLVVQLWMGNKFLTVIHDRVRPK
jgi:hypothetical protein